MVRKKKSNFEKSALRTERTGTFEGHVDELSSKESWNHNLK